ncbi:L,D-transpeptidase family protein [Hymenobacter sp. 15J16-1T3B]|uniref:L,D-transpeptidase family protein n=1 Tax=Hymenobacter sp. 15J16-1T3B TaxID=2886941 RepID=UPI001D0F7D09|nr:L,D-transpeptidase family protein [Hymenobacter sp. 15J16-1T3B]MCC3157157.1 L,D-transpeptidase family protein [Hymenobacter sp. 15J16-1T3B]
MSHSVEGKLCVCLGLLFCLVLGQTAAAQTNADVAAQLRQRLAAPAAADNEMGAELQRFYAQVNYAPVWTTATGPRAAATAGLKLLRQARDYGLRSDNAAQQAPARVLDSLALPALDSAARLSGRVRAELLLTAQLLQFTTQLRRGHVRPESLQPTTCTADSTFDPVFWLLSARSCADFSRQVLAAQPQSRSYVRLLGAWQRLLRTDSAAARRQQWLVAANLQRLRWEPAADSLYCVVNIPAYSLQVVRRTKVLRTCRVVVGAPATPTPELCSRIRFFETSPRWNVPRSIATREMLPQLRRNPGFLDDNNYILYDRQGRVPNPRRINWKEVSAESFPYVIRQAATSDNALGNVVFRFPNPHDIFLHDTPARRVFSQPKRALSHGCIRLQNPLQLAVFLLRHDFADQPSRAQRNVERMWDSVYGGYSKYFPLRYPVPVYVRYLTCHADDGPSLRQLPDIYGRDATLIAALRGQVAEGAMAGE